jgi:hypothetical protein
LTNGEFSPSMASWTDGWLAVRGACGWRQVVEEVVGSARSTVYPASARVSAAAG